MNEHSATLHAAATGHLPFFITAPGEGDGLFKAMIVFLVVVVFSVGLLYLRLHALPERLAHGASPTGQSPAPADAVPTPADGSGASAAPTPPSNQ